MRRLILPVSVLGSISVVQASGGLDKAVDNFRLIDHQGVAHELYYSSNRKAIVIGVHAVGCPAVTDAVSALDALRARHGKDIEVLMLDPAANANRDAIAAAVIQSKRTVPVMIDTSQLVGEGLNATRAGEVLVIDTKGWKLAYRGDPKGAADAVGAVIAQQPVKVASTAVQGCAIAMPGLAQKKQYEKISYVKTIAPLLQEKCVTCHQEGGGAPWAMSSYEMVKGFSPMIREVVRTARMPPWHADPHYQTFVDARVMSDEQKRTLIHWIEAGSPRGEGSDPLIGRHSTATEWTLGTPDLILEVPPFEIPATGVVEYQYPRLKNPLDRDVWVRAIEAKPGSTQTVHHIITHIEDPLAPMMRNSRQGNVQLGGWAPGETPNVYATDTGAFLPKGTEFVFQMHYTPNGKATTDHSRVALYFNQEKPKYPIQTGAMLRTDFVIPAGDPAYTSKVEKTWTQDVVLYHLMPHSHVRGKAAKMTAFYPDGRMEVLLNVPRYDFNWQNIYKFDKEKTIPKGTRFVWEMTWDNSPQNLANPDPTQAVKWGDQTFEEMGIGWMSYRNLGESADDLLRAREVKRQKMAQDEAKKAASPAAGQ